MTGCRPTRFVPAGEYLVDKMTIRSKNNDLDKDEMTSIVKQKPNRKILGFIRFHLAVYNYAHKDTTRRFRRWLERTIGEPPLILDTNLTRRSNNQLKLYLSQQGYFDGIVKDTTYYRKKRAKVVYTVTANKPYYLNKLNYMIADSLLEPYIFKDTADCIIKTGQVYKEKNLSAEQQRITTQLRNQGYYQFIKENIYYDADSSLPGNFVNLTMVITDRFYNTKEDSVLIESHKQFVIEKIYILPEYSLQRDMQVFKDTVKVSDGVYICYNDKLKFKKNTLLKPLFFKPGDLYSQKATDNTYLRFTSLRVFKATNIQYEFTREDQFKGYLNTSVKLIPFKKQSYSISSEGTISSGNYGISGTLGYQNRNIFRGAEIFEIKLRGGLEVQKLAVDVNNQADNVIPITTFNTVEVGPEFSITTPRSIFRFIPPASNPRSTFSASTNFQRRPDYTRVIATTAYSITASLTRFTKIIWSPIDFNYVWINKSAAFQQSLNSINDILIKQSYYNLLIPSIGLKAAVTYNNQELKTKRSHTYLRVSFEPSGNIPTWYYKLAGKEKETFVSDDGDTVTAYRVFNLAYSQFVRGEIDFRKYFDLNYKRKFVVRGVVGVGVPYGNSRALPFVRSFFGGGTNDMRA